MQAPKEGEVISNYYKRKYSEIKDGLDLTQIENGFEHSCMKLEQDCNGTWNWDRTWK